MTHLEGIGDADHQSASPIAPDPVQAPFAIRHEDGSEEVVDQQLNELPFSAHGRFDPTQG